MKKGKNNPQDMKRNSVPQNISYTEAFSGPIPPPNLLERYEAITPGAADRILTMAENQSKHRIAAESEKTIRSISRE